MNFYKQDKVVDTQSSQNILLYRMKVSSTHLGAQVIKKGVGTTKKEFVKTI